MTYTISELAKLAGISTRTLRYYDKIGLLVPEKSANRYRIYGEKDVDRLQQILFYRELGLPLVDIKTIMASRDFDRMAALQSHLEAMKTRRSQLDILIANVEKTISTAKGDTVMNDKEKFDGFMQKLVDDNEKEYGREVRAKHGNDAVDRSNMKVKNMSREQYGEVEDLSHAVNETLKTAFKQGNPQSPLAQKACALHKEWLRRFWDTYSKEAHIGLAQMYVDDPRFRAYYDNIAPGCAEFLRDALLVYCQ